MLAEIQVRITVGYRDAVRCVDCKVAPAICEIVFLIGGSRHRHRNRVWSKRKAPLIAGRNTFGERWNV